MTAPLACAALLFLSGARHELMGRHCAVSIARLACDVRPDLLRRNEEQDELAYLASPCWRCREHAAELLACPTMAQIGLLARGERSADAEVAMRCRAILARVRACPVCLGTGKGEWSYSAAAGGYGWACPKCDGTGTADAGGHDRRDVANVAR